MRTPVKRTPVIRTPVQRPITVGSRIKLKVSDKKQLGCLIIGMTGRVSKMHQDGICYVILDCGHMCYVPLVHLEKSNFDKCVTCQELKHRSELRVPSFWKSSGSGGLCLECCKIFKINRYEKRGADEKPTRSKRSPRS